MNNESHGNKVQALIDKLQDISNIEYLEDDEMAIINKAIEAIRVLQLIANHGATMPIEPDEWGGEQCASAAIDWINLLEAI